MNDSAIDTLIQVLQKDARATSEELGAVNACLLDVPEGVQQILTELVPKLIGARRNPDQLLDSIVELRVALDHVKDHAADAVEALQTLADRLERSFS